MLTIEPPPETVFQAQDRLDELYCEILRIEAQLSDSSRVGLDGKRMSSDMYRAWRSKALRALASKRGEYRMLSRWLARETAKIPDKALALLRACREALRSRDEDTGDLLADIEKLLGEV